MLDFSLPVWVYRISFYTIIFIPVLMGLLISKNKQNKPYVYFVAIIGIILEVLSFVPPLKLFVQNDFPSIFAIILFYYFADMYTLGPFLLLVIFGILFLKNKIKTKAAKIIFVFLLIMDIIFIVLRVID